MVRKKIDGFDKRLSDTLLGTGLPTTTIARDLGVAPDTVAGWISGEKCPQAASIADICRRYKISADWLLGLSDRRERR